MAKTQRPHGRQPKARKPNCRECGLCCIAPLPTQEVFCDVTPADYEALPPKVRRKVVAISIFERVAAALSGVRNHPEAVLKTERKLQTLGPLEGIALNCCCCLEGTIMKRVKCSIYAQRPEICKTACKPGDRVCCSLRKQWPQACEDALSP